MEALTGLDRSELSVVVVGVDTDCDSYCSGCVIVKSKAFPQSGNKTLILTSSEFVHGQENDLTVVFWDKKKLKATVLARDNAFCLLATDFYDRCEAIRLLEGNHGLVNSRTFMRVPIAPTVTRLVYTYTTCKSLESYTVDGQNLVANSADYFMVSCDYLNNKTRGVNRLTGAPVFSALDEDDGTAGRTIGVILQDCRHEVGCSGAEFKVALTASRLRESILVPPQEKNHSLTGGKKRKRTTTPGVKGRKATKL